MRSEKTAARRWCLWINLSLLILFPLAWIAPVLRAGLLPFLGGDEVSILGGVRALWPDERLLAVLIALFGMVVPYAKTLALAGMQLGWISSRPAPVIRLLGKLSMADIFLIALGIVVAKGAGLGHVESAWGLPLFALCVLLSLAVSILSEKVLE